MRIGILVSLGVGGADKSSFYLAKGLRELGEDVVIFYTKQSFPNPNMQWDDTSLSLSRYQQYNSFENYMIEHPSEFKNYGIQILNTHRPGDDTWFVPGFEDETFPFPVVETNFHGELKSKADFRVYPSQTLVESKNIQQDNKNIVIFNPIMPVLSEETLREELGIADENFVFGRISRGSNDIFSPICYLAYKKIETDNTCFIQMGANEASRNIVKQLNIKNYKEVDPTIDDIRISKFYNTFDIYLHSNRLGETFGNTIAEAMMHGKPVVSHLGESFWPQAQSEVLGLQEYVVAERQVSAFNEYASLMKKLMDDKNLYIKQSDYCKDRAFDNFNYKVVAMKYLEVFDKAIKY